MKRVVGCTTLVIFAIVMPGCSCVPQQRPDRFKVGSRRPETAKANMTKSPAAKSDAPSSPSAVDGQPAPTPASETKPALASEPPAARSKPGSLASLAAAFGEQLEPKTGNPAELSPAEACREAGALRDAAVKLEAKGQSGEAFTKALSAWQLVQAHPNDSECASLAQELAPLVVRLGEATNAVADVYSRPRKPVIIE